MSRLRTAFLGCTLVLAAAALAPAQSFAVPAPDERSELGSLTQLRDYQSRRVSSNDKSGANVDGGPELPPGASRTLADIKAAGVIRHIWVTIADEEKFHLKKLVLRMYWDDETTPSVEAPIGDFFGLNLGEYVEYESAPLSVGHWMALNSYFPMPFGKRARIEVTNEGTKPVLAFYFHIDYEQHAHVADSEARFHAQYRQAMPNHGWTNQWTSNGKPPEINTRSNLDGKHNYVILEAKGRGHFVGVTQGVQQNQSDWWGEGDDMMFIDGDTKPTIVGTGAEDYYLGAWCYGGCGFNKKGTFAYQRYGNPVNGGDERGAKWQVYRYHLESPINFNSSIKVTIESGHANHRSDNYFTTAFWYQQEPHGPQPALPPVDARIPRLKNTGGPEETEP